MSTTDSISVSSEPLRFAYWVPNVSGGLVVSKIEQRTDWSYDYNVKLARLAEDNGFEYALSQVRYIASYGAAYQHESTSFSLALLLATQRLKVIAAIHPGLWHPGVLAKWIATADQLSGGRAAINVVSGWFKDEFTKLGEPWLEHGERYRRSEEFIRYVKEIWTGEHAEFNGDFYRLHDFDLKPKPVTGEGRAHPEVFQGGNSVDARGMAGRVSDWYFANGNSPDGVEAQIRDVREVAQVHGRTVRFGVNGFLIARDTEAEARDVLREIVDKADREAVEGFGNAVKQAGQSTGDGKGMWQDSEFADLVQYNDGFRTGLIGTPEQIAERIVEFKRRGVNLLLLGFLHYLEDVEYFGRHVLPIVRELEAGVMSEPACTVPVLDAAAAVAAASGLAEAFAAGAAERDAGRVLPHAELDRLSASGLLAITVPAEHGGAGASTATLTEVVRLLAAGDPNIAQIPHSHFVYVNQLRLRGDADQQARLFTEVLRGKRFGNAQTEFGTRHVRDFRTTLTPDGAGRWLLDGEKFYCTGALFAHWIPVLAHLGADGPMHVAWVRRDAEGVEVVDDWDGLGQRTTASGTVRLKQVEVTDEWITPYAVTFEGPQTYGAFAQVLHAAIDAGIARVALEEAAAFVRTKSRPYPDAGVERAADDPLTVHAFGEMELGLRGAEALLAHAASAVDDANADLTEATAAEASLAVAAARAQTAHVSVQIASRVFEVAGTRSALASLNLDRHWRNARTHTLHDPAAWKVQHLGRWALDGTPPPRHGQL